VADDLLKKRSVFVYVFWVALVIFVGVFVYIGNYFYRYQLLKKGIVFTNQTESELGFKNMGVTKVNDVDVNLKTFTGLVVEKKDREFVMQNGNGNKVNVLVVDKTVFMEAKFRKCEPDVEGCQKLIKIENQTLKYGDIKVGDQLEVNLIFPENIFQKENYYEAGIILLNKKGES